MKKIKIISALLATSLTTAALYAAPGMTTETVTRAEALAKADERFAKMDVNNDGTLDQADRAAKVRANFAVMDSDKNGSVTEAEFVTAHEARIAKREDRREMRAERKGKGGHAGHRMGGRGKMGGGMMMMAKADANGDKAVTKAEFRASAEARFVKSDANNDGSISADERKAQRNGKWGNRPATPADAN